MNRFRPIDRKTDYLLPPSLDDWLPEDHLARFILEAIERLDLSALTRVYGGRGSAAYHPEVLLSLLVYGYATGTFSSRKIERATYDSLAFRYLAAGSHPDHDTLASFRRRFLDELADIFLQVLELAGEMKLLKLGTISLDGTTPQRTFLWPYPGTRTPTQDRSAGAPGAGRKRRPDRTPRWH